MKNRAVRAVAFRGRPPKISLSGTWRKSCKSSAYLSSCSFQAPWSSGRFREPAPLEIRGIEMSLLDKLRGGQQLLRKDPTFKCEAVKDWTSWNSMEEFGPRAWNRSPDARS